VAKRISYPISAVVAFRNSQGLEARGSLLRLTRQQVVFEVYNPYSIVQLSEVLSELRITQGERETYRGRAVVTNLLNTGLMLIVTASLVDPWSELKGLAPGEILRTYVKEFVADWEAGNAALDRDVQVATANLRNYLQELSRWLEHSETEAGVTERNTSRDTVLSFVVDVDSQIAPKLGELYFRFEESIGQVDRKALPVHRSYVQHELHPLMMCSPFMHRAYTKPLGYAGDYQMVRMMLDEPWDGANSFAKLLNASALRHEAPAAHRNRIRLLAEAIEAEARRVVSQDRAFRVLNIGCGPAVEVRDFLRANPGLASRSEFHLVDFNAETLEHVQQDFAPLAEQTGARAVIRTEQRSIHDIIRASVEGEKEPPAGYDMVYCAGLFDYFRDATCSYLLQLFHSWTSDGGLLLVTNVTPRHSSVGIMGVVLEWNLELRSEAAMLELAPQLGRQSTHLDPTGVNVFLAIRK
jgi:extracellular factor (EF) 3-hydroxypalmitic acid methyl ester biosynthesis protein